MAHPTQVQDACDWYEANLAVYEDFCRRLEALVKEILVAEGIPFHSVSGRAKTLDSYRTKARQDKYSVPRDEIKDMAGVRVITYVDSDARAVAESIERNFQVDLEHSDNTALRLGVDRVGYRSIHYLCMLSDSRRTLPEFGRFAELKVEIQVRTILQHAWSEVEHDRSYKFAGVLPDELKRRFNILAGLLELADKEFDAIASAVDEYSKDIGERTDAGDLKSIPLNSTALIEYLQKKMPESLATGFLEPDFNGGDEKLLAELDAFGVHTLDDLDAIMPMDYDSNLASILKEGLGESNFIGLVREVMMISNAEKYFSDAWQGHWHGFSLPSVFPSYGIDIEDFVGRYNLNRI